MKANPLTLIAILAGGTAVTVVVKPSPSVWIPAVGFVAAVIAIIIWVLSCGGDVNFWRTARGFRLKLGGVKARRQSTQPRTTPSRARSGVPSAGVHTSESATGSASRFAAAAIVVLLLFGGMWAVSKAVHSPPAGAHSSETKQSPRPAPTQPVASTSHLGPKATVEAYFHAINHHDWKALWQIWPVATETGHRSLYRRIAMGYRLTKHDDITSIHAHGDVVHVRVLASETTGAVQTYAFRYVVHHGHITHGWSRLLSAQQS